MKQNHTAEAMIIYVYEGGLPPTCGAVAEGATQCPQSGADHSAMPCAANEDQSNQEGMLHSLWRGAHIPRYLHWCDLSTSVRDAVDQLLREGEAFGFHRSPWFTVHSPDLFGSPHFAR